MLEPLIVHEGLPSIRAKAEELLHQIVTAVIIMTAEAKAEGYERAKERLVATEGMLEVERRERKKLESERMGIGEKEVRRIMKEEVGEEIRNYERHRGEERIKEWNVRELEIGVEMRRVVEAWGNKRWEMVRGELRGEMEEVLNRSEGKGKEGMVEWWKAVQDREGRLGDEMRKELKEILDRREARTRELVGEEVRKALKALEERRGSMEGTRDSHGGHAEGVEGDFGEARE